MLLAELYKPYETRQNDMTEPLTADRRPGVIGVPGEAILGRVR